MTAPIPNHESQAADDLYAYLHGSDPSDLSNLPGEEAELAAALHSLSHSLQPDPVLEMALEQRLAQRGSPPAGERFSLAGLLRGLAWAGMAAALLLGLAWVLQNLRPATTPALETVFVPVTGTPVAGATEGVAGPVIAVATATPFATLAAPSATPFGTQAPLPTPAGPIYESAVLAMGPDSGLTLQTELPDGPAEMTVYRQQPLQPLTLEAAQKLAAQFDIEGPAYQLPVSVPGSAGFMIENRQASLYVNGNTSWFDYNRSLDSSGDSAASPENVSFETLIAQAEAFLRPRGLLDFSYLTQPHAFMPGGVTFIATLDGYPVRYNSDNGPQMTVVVGESGQLLNISANLLQYSPEGRFPIISAQEAWELVRQTEAMSRVETSEWYSFNMPTTGGWVRMPRDNQRTELFAYLEVYQAAESGQPPLIKLYGSRLVGQLDGLAEAAGDQSLMQLWGQFQLLDGERVFAVEGWQKSPLAEGIIKGILRRQGERAVLETEQGLLLLPELPEDVPADTEVSVQGVRIEEPEPSIIWTSLWQGDSAGGGGGGGGGGGNFGLLELNLSSQPENALPATATPLPVDPGPFQAGQRLEAATGKLWVVDHQYTDGSHRLDATLILDAGPGWPEGIVVQLSGEPMAEIAALHLQPVQVWGEIVTAGSLPNLRLERIERRYPDVPMLVLKGEAQIVTLEGQEVILFTSSSGETYVLRSSLDNVEPEAMPWESSMGEAVTGLAMPDQQFGGYAILEDNGLMPVMGNQTIEVSPPVIRESGTPGQPRIAMIEKVELVYYTSDPRFGAMDPTAALYVQPVWRFSGRVTDGHYFEIFVQALAPQYLK